MTWTRQRESGWIPMFPQKMTFLVHKHIVSGSVLSNWQKLCFIAENSQDLVLMVTRKISSFSLESSLSQLVNNAPALRSQVTTSGDLRWRPRCCSPQVRSKTCAPVANLSSDSSPQLTWGQLSSDFFCFLVFFLSPNLASTSWLIFLFLGGRPNSELDLVRSSSGDWPSPPAERRRSAKNWKREF